MVDGVRDGAAFDGGNRLDDSGPVGVFCGPRVDIALLAQGVVGGKGGVSREDVRVAELEVLEQFGEHGLADGDGDGRLCRADP
jgi:hypothetical protein